MSTREGVQLLVGDGGREERSFLLSGTVDVKVEGGHSAKTRRRSITTQDLLVQRGNFLVPQGRHAASTAHTQKARTIRPFAALPPPPSPLPEGWEFREDPSKVNRRSRLLRVLQLPHMQQQKAKRTLQTGMELPSPSRTPPSPAATLKQQRNSPRVRRAGATQGRERKGSHRASPLLHLQPGVGPRRGERFDRTSGEWVDAAQPPSLLDLAAAARDAEEVHSSLKCEILSSAVRRRIEEADQCVKDAEVALASLDALHEMENSTYADFDAYDAAYRVPREYAEAIARRATDTLLADI